MKSLSLVSLTFCLLTCSSISWAKNLNPQYGSITKALAEDTFYQKYFTAIQQDRGFQSCESNSSLPCEQQKAIFTKVLLEQVETLTSKSIQQILDQTSLSTFSENLIWQLAQEYQLRAWFPSTPHLKILDGIEKIQPPSSQMIKDLYFDAKTGRKIYKNGDFENVPVLFMFCRKDRRYPCRFILKDKEGQAVRDSNGKLWSLSSLGYSRHLKEFYQFNGNTPSGVFEIDGAMPIADKPKAFGKFRRLILNMIASSPNEEQYKLLLPTSSENHNWWHESVIAREVGRGLFRIHGTGTRNDDRNTPYYGFYPTSGCVESRENTYDGTNYINQRLLLNALMKASQMKVGNENEINIRALLYIVNINNKKSSVQLLDLKDFGIF